MASGEQVMEDLFGFAELTDESRTIAVSDTAPGKVANITAPKLNVNKDEIKRDTDEVVIPIMNEKTGVKKYKVLARHQVEDDEDIRRPSVTERESPSSTEQRKENINIIDKNENVSRKVQERKKGVKNTKHLNEKKGKTHSFKHLKQSSSDKKLQQKVGKFFQKRTEKAVVFKKDTKPIGSEAMNDPRALHYEFHEDSDSGNNVTKLKSSSALGTKPSPEQENETEMDIEEDVVNVEKNVVKPEIPLKTECHVKLKRDPSIDSLYTSKASDEGKESDEISNCDLLDSHESGSAKRKLSSDCPNSGNVRTTSRQNSLEEAQKRAAAEMVFNADIQVRKSGRLKSAKCASRYRGDYGIRVDTYKQLISKTAKISSVSDGQEVSEIEGVLSDSSYKSDVENKSVAKKTSKENQDELLLENASVFQTDNDNFTFVKNRKGTGKTSENMVFSGENDCVENQEQEHNNSSCKISVDCADAPHQENLHLTKLGIEMKIESMSQKSEQCGLEGNDDGNVVSDSLKCKLTCDTIVPCVDKPKQCIELTACPENFCDERSRNADNLRHTLFKEKNIDLELQKETVSKAAIDTQIAQEKINEKLASLKNPRVEVEVTGRYVHSVGKSVKKSLKRIETRRKSKETILESDCKSPSPEMSPAKDPVITLENLRQKLFEKAGADVVEADKVDKQFESKVIASKHVKKPKTVERSKSSLGFSETEPEIDVKVGDSSSQRSGRSTPRCSTPRSDTGKDILEEVAKSLNALHKAKKKTEDSSKTGSQKRRRFEEKKFLLRSMVRSGDIGIHDSAIFDAEIVSSKDKTEESMTSELKSHQKTVDDNISESNSSVSEETTIQERKRECEEDKDENSQLDKKTSKPKTVKCSACNHVFKTKELLRKHYPCRVRQTRTWSQNKLRPNRAVRRPETGSKKFVCNLPKPSKQDSSKPRPQLLIYRKTKFRRVKGKRRRKLYQLIQELRQKRQPVKWHHLCIIYDDISFKEQCLYKLGLMCVGHVSEGLEKYTAEEITEFEKHRAKERMLAEEERIFQHSILTEMSADTSYLNTSTEMGTDSIESECLSPTSLTISQENTSNFICDNKDRKDERTSHHFEKSNEQRQQAMTEEYAQSEEETEDSEYLEEIPEQKYLTAAIQIEKSFSPDNFKLTKIDTQFLADEITEMTENSIEDVVSMHSKQKNKEEYKISEHNMMLFGQEINNGFNHGEEVLDIYETTEVKGNLFDTNNESDLMELSVSPVHVSGDHSQLDEDKNCAEISLQVKESQSGDVVDMERMKKVLMTESDLADEQVYRMRNDKLSLSVKSNDPVSKLTAKCSFYMAPDIELYHQTASIRENEIENSEERLEHDIKDEISSQSHNFTADNVGDTSMQFKKTEAEINTNLILQAKDLLTDILTNVEKEIKGHEPVTPPVSDSHVESPLKSVDKHHNDKTSINYSSVKKSPVKGILRNVGFESVRAKEVPKELTPIKERNYVDKGSSPSGVGSGKKKIDFKTYAIRKGMIKEVDEQEKETVRSEKQYEIADSLLDRLLDAVNVIDSIIEDQRELAGIKDGHGFNAITPEMAFKVVASTSYDQEKGDFDKPYDIETTFYGEGTDEDSYEVYIPSKILLPESDEMLGNLMIPMEVSDNNTTSNIPDFISDSEKNAKNHDYYEQNAAKIKLYGEYYTANSAKTSCIAPDNVEEYYQTEQLENKPCSFALNNSQNSLTNCRNELDMEDENIIKNRTCDVYAHKKTKLITEGRNEDVDTENTSEQIDRFEWNESDQNETIDKEEYTTLETKTSSDEDYDNTVCDKAKHDDLSHEMFDTKTVNNDEEKIWLSPVKAKDNEVSPSMSGSKDLVRDKDFRNLSAETQENKLSQSILDTDVLDVDEDSTKSSNKTNNNEISNIISKSAALNIDEQIMNLSDIRKGNELSHSISDTEVLDREEATIKSPDKTKGDEISNIELEMATPDRDEETIMSLDKTKDYESCNSISETEVHDRDEKIMKSPEQVPLKRWKQTRKEHSKNKAIKESNRDFTIKYEMNGIVVKENLLTGDKNVVENSSPFRSSTESDTEPSEFDVTGYDSDNTQGTSSEIEGSHDSSEKYIEEHLDENVISKAILCDDSKEKKYHSETIISDQLINSLHEDSLTCKGGFATKKKSYQELSEDQYLDDNYYEEGNEPNSINSQKVNKTSELLDNHDELSSGPKSLEKNDAPCLGPEAIDDKELPMVESHVMLGNEVQCLESENNVLLDVSISDLKRVSDDHSIGSPPVLEKVDVVETCIMLESDHESEQSELLEEDGPPELIPEEMDQLQCVDEKTEADAMYVKAQKKNRTERHFLDVLDPVTDEEAQNNNSNIKQSVCKESTHRKLELDPCFDDSIRRHFSDVVIAPGEEPKTPKSDLQFLFDSSENGEVTLAQLKKILTPISRKEKKSSIPKESLLKIKSGIASLLSKVKKPVKKDPAWLKRDALSTYAKRKKLKKKYEHGNDFSDLDSSSDESNTEEENLLFSDFKTGKESSKVSIADNILQMLTCLEDKGSIASNMSNLLDILAENLVFISKEDRHNKVKECSNSDSDYSCTDENKLVFEKNSVENTQRELIADFLTEGEQPPSLDDIPTAEDTEDELNPRDAHDVSISSVGIEKDECLLHEVIENENSTRESTPSSQTDMNISESGQSNNSFTSDLKKKKHLSDELDFISNDRHTETSCTSCTSPEQNEDLTKSKGKSKAKRIFKSITELNSIETDEESECEGSYDPKAMSARFSELKAIANENTKWEFNSDYSSDGELSDRYDSESDVAHERNCIQKIKRNTADSVAEEELKENVYKLSQDTGDLPEANPLEDGQNTLKNVVLSPYNALENTVLDEGRKTDTENENAVKIHSLTAVSKIEKGIPSDTSIIAISYNTENETKPEHVTENNVTIETKCLLSVGDEYIVNDEFDLEGVESRSELTTCIENDKIKILDDRTHSYKDDVITYKSIGVENNASSHLTYNEHKLMLYVNESLKIEADSVNTITNNSCHRTEDCEHYVELLPRVQKNFCNKNEVCSGGAEDIPCIETPEFLASKAEQNEKTTSIDTAGTTFNETSEYLHQQTPTMLVVEQTSNDINSGNINEKDCLGNSNTDSSGEGQTGKSVQEELISSLLEKELDGEDSDATVETDIYETEEVFDEKELQSSPDTLIEPNSEAVINTENITEIIKVSGRLDTCNVSQKNEEIKISKTMTEPQTSNSETMVQPITSPRRDNYYDVKSNVEDLTKIKTHLAAVTDNSVESKKSDIKQTELSSFTQTLNSWKEEYSEAYCESIAEKVKRKQRERSRSTCYTFNPLLYYSSVYARESTKPVKKEISVFRSSILEKRAREKSLPPDMNENLEYPASKRSRSFSEAKSGDNSIISGQNGTQKSDIEVDIKPCTVTLQKLTENIIQKYTNRKRVAEQDEMSEGRPPIKVTIKLSQIVYPPTSPYGSTSVSSETGRSGYESCSEESEYSVTELDEVQNLHEKTLDGSKKVNEAADIETPRERQPLKIKMKTLLTKMNSVDVGEEIETFPDNEQNKVCASLAATKEKLVEDNVTVAPNELPDQNGCFMLADVEHPLNVQRSPSVDKNISPCQNESSTETNPGSVEEMIESEVLHDISKECDDYSPKEEDVLFFLSDSDVESNKDSTEMENFKSINVVDSLPDKVMAAKSETSASIHAECGESDVDLSESDTDSDVQEEIDRILNETDGDIKPASTNDLEKKVKKEGNSLMKMIVSHLYLSESDSESELCSVDKNRQFNSQLDELSDEVPKTSKTGSSSKSLFSECLDNDEKLLCAENRKPGKSGANSVKTDKGKELVLFSGNEQNLSCNNMEQTEYTSCSVSQRQEARSYSEEFAIHSEVMDSRVFNSSAENIEITKSLDDSETFDSMQSKESGGYQVYSDCPEEDGSETRAKHLETSELTDEHHSELQELSVGVKLKLVEAESAVKSLEEDVFQEVKPLQESTDEEMMYYAVELSDNYETNEAVVNLEISELVEGPVIIENTEIIAETAVHSNVIPSHVNEPLELTTEPLNEQVIENVFEEKICDTQISSVANVAENTAELDSQNLFGGGTECKYLYGINEDSQSSNEVVEELVTDNIIGDPNPKQNTDIEISSLCPSDLLSCGPEKEYFDQTEESKGLSNCAPVDQCEIRESDTIVHEMSAGFGCTDQTSFVDYSQPIDYSNYISFPDSHVTETKKLENLCSANEIRSPFKTDNLSHGDDLLKERKSETVADISCDNIEYPQSVVQEECGMEYEQTEPLDYTITENEYFEEEPMDIV